MKNFIFSDSKIDYLYETANFFHVKEILVYDNLNALDWYLTITKATPKWIDFLMSIRNNIVKFLKLKDVGNISNVPDRNNAQKYSVGDLVGIFKIKNINFNEVVFEIIDTHLDVFLSVKVTQNTTSSFSLSVTTAVCNKNFVGYLYMIPVAQMHKLIVHHMLKKYDFTNRNI